MADEILLVKASRHKIVFIYGLADPRDNIIRYIGKAEDLPQRLRGHLSEARRGKGAKSEWLRSLLAEGLRPVIVTLEEVAVGSSWAAAERRQIALHKASGVVLLNRTEGGEGVPDVARTPEWIAKGVEARRQNPDWIRHMKALHDANRGRALTPETKAKIGAALRGRTLSAEHCAKVSAAQRGRPAHPNSIAGAAKAHRGKPESDETKAKKRKAMGAHRESHAARQREKWQDPEFRTRVTENMRGKSPSDDARKKIGEASRAGWADEETRRRRTEGVRAFAQSEENRQNRREIARRLWSDPEFRERMKRARKK